MELKTLDFLSALRMCWYSRPMFTSIYFYRVPKEKVDQFLVIQKTSAEIYRKHGAIDDWTFGPETLVEKYGCSSFLKEISVEPNELLFFSLSLFKSKEDHDQVMSIVDKDPAIGALYDQVRETIDISKVIRGEFNRFV